MIRFALFLFAVVAVAQPTPALPTTLYAAGAGYTPGGAHAAPWVNYTTCKGDNCSITTYDVTAPAGRLTAAMRTGFATYIKTYHLGALDIHVFAFGNVGVATVGTGPAASSSSLVGSFSGGGVGAIRLKNGFTFILTERVQKNGSLTNNVAEFGLGYSK